MSDNAGLGVRLMSQRVVPGLLDGLAPPPTDVVRLLVGGEAQGRGFHPGAHSPGEDQTRELPEPSLMLVDPTTPDEMQEHDPRTSRR
jgi:hypothetical protein